MDETMCPHCGMDLQGDPIPPKYRESGLYGSATHYSRTIGVEVRGAYDGVLYWQCPDCGGKWHRWEEGHYLRRRASQYIG